MKRVTINDVAARARVSVATVSRALRGLPNVSPMTRQRVEAAALELDYEADSRAASLASGRTNVIGLVAPDFGSWYIGQILAGVEQGLTAAGYDLLVYSIDRSPDRHGQLRDRLRSGRVDGLLMVDFFLGADVELAVPDPQMPVVTTGERVAGASSVTIDNLGGGRAAGEHLVALGHRRIAFVGGVVDGQIERGPTDRARLAGLEDALADVGVDGVVADIQGHYTIDGGRQALRLLLEDHPDCTAVFCGSDEMAMGIMFEAADGSMSTPGDLSVVGFDGHDLAGPVGLTTVGQPVVQIGVEAVGLLLERLNRSDGAVRNIDVPLTLIERASTGRPVDRSPANDVA